MEQTKLFITLLYASHHAISSRVTSFLFEGNYDCLLNQVLFFKTIPHRFFEEILLSWLLALHLLPSLRVSAETDILGCILKFDWTNPMST